MVGLGVLTVLAACDDPTQPAEPRVTPRAPEVAALHRQYNIRDLGTFGGDEAGALGINELGEVVGFAQLPSGSVRAFLWRPGQGRQSLGTLGGANSRARAINDRGEVTGISEIRGSDVPHGFLWTKDGGMRDLGSLGDGFTEAWAINNRREVVGYAENLNHRPRAFLWRPGRGIRSLGTLGGKESFAFGINDATQVVGSSLTPDGNSHAFLWTAAGGMEDLGTLGGPNSEATAISQNGVVVGSSETAAATQEAFMWTREGGMRSLGALGRHTSAGANAVNTHQRVAGSTGPIIPFLWTPEAGMRRLPTLGGGQGFPRHMNEFGQIVGFSTSEDGTIRAALWTPVTGPLAVAGIRGSADLDAADSDETDELPRIDVCHRLGLRITELRDEDLRRACRSRSSLSARSVLK
jgi:probable HAF family extracellular repeat protein